MIAPSMAPDPAFPPVSPPISGSDAKKPPRRSPRIRPDWWSKSLGGVLLGFTLAVGLSGVFAWAGPDGILGVNKYQFNMWLIAPLWLGVVSFCFLFRSGLRCWLWLGGANLLTHGALLLLRATTPL